MKRGHRGIVPDAQNSTVQRKRLSILAGGRLSDHFNPITGAVYFTFFFWFSQSS